TLESKLIQNAIDIDRRKIDSGKQNYNQLLQLKWRHCRNFPDNARLTPPTEVSGGCVKIKLFDVRH
ncbi:hypothetical protein CVE31_26940, partial [Pseudomonas syringae pv. actinidiae]